MFVVKKLPLRILLVVLIQCFSYILTLGSFSLCFLIQLSFSSSVHFFLTPCTAFFSSFLFFFLSLGFIYSMSFCLVLPPCISFHIFRRAFLTHLLSLALYPSDLLHQKKNVLYFFLSLTKSIIFVSLPAHYLHASLLGKISRV